MSFDIGQVLAVGLSGKLLRNGSLSRRMGWTGGSRLSVIVDNFNLIECATVIRSRL